VKDSNPEANNDVLQCRRVEFLYRQSALTQASGLVIAAIYVFISWKHVAHWHLAGWFALATFIYISRMGLRAWFTRTFLVTHKSFRAEFWERVFALGVFFSGLNWGLAAIFLLSPHSVLHQAFLGLLMAGTTAGACVAYSASIRSVLSFLAPALLPLAMRLTIEGGEFQDGMAFMLIFYFFMITGLILRNNKYVVSSLRLHIEKDILLKELQDAQAKIIHSTKMAALGEMASGIAHEINNPLTTMKFKLFNLRELASVQSSKSGMILDTAVKLDSLVDRIAKIVLGLRAFAREDSKDPMEIFSIDSLITETLSFCESRFQNNQISLTVDKIEIDRKFNGRRTQLSQVLLNLLNNAFDAVEGVKGGWVRIQAYSVGEMIRIAVVDNGSGISKENRDKIMQPFFTTKGVGKGTGLGLSIAHGIIEEHGGKLSLDTSSPHTRFVIALPLSLAKNNSKVAA
jgi:signal transduction histidine kinase